jgi:hypothetical protein
MSYEEEFKNRIRILDSEKILKDGYWFLDIPKYERI